MKKLFLVLGFVLNVVLGMAQTPQAIWTEGNKTLTFYYGKLYKVGDMFNGQRVTKVWSGDNLTCINNPYKENEDLAIPGWIAESVDLGGPFDNIIIKKYTEITELMERAVFDKSFKNVKLDVLSSLFRNCKNLKTIVGIENLCTEKVVWMNYMFYDCQSLYSLDVSEFDTRNVTNMSYMFSGCQSLSSLDVSKFDTRNVTNMFYMFSGCQSLSSLDVSKFDTRNVTNMCCMFSGCQSLSSLDVSKFDTRNVTNMRGMFGSCRSLSNLDVGQFDTREVTDMQGMFYACQSLLSLDVSQFDTRNVNAMGTMFYGCQSLRSLDVSNFNTRKLMSIGYMFGGCKSLSSIDVRNFDIKWITNLSGLFDGCSSLTEIDLSNFDTKNVVAMKNMFRGCSALQLLRIDNFSVEKLKDIQEMFSDCGILEKIYCTNNWINLNENIQGVDMFKGCTNLVGAVHFDASKIDAAMANPKTGYFTGDKITIEKDEFDYGITWTDAELNPKEYRFDELQSGTFIYLLDGEDVTDKISDAGTYTVTIRFMSDDNKIDYSQDFEVTIEPLDISECQISPIPSQDYTCSEIMPTISITYKNEKLIESTDFTVDFSNNIEVGTATVKIVGKGNYCGEVEKTFEINSVEVPKVDIAETDITEIAAEIFNAEYHTPEILISFNGEKLVENQDFEIKFSDNFNVGTATVKIYGKDDFCGEVEKHFEIKPLNISECQISPISSQDYTCREITPSISISYKNEKLIESTDFTVEFSNNIEVGTATAKIVGKGNYCGEVEKMFEINSVNIEPEPDPEPQDDCQNNSGQNLKTKWDDVVYVPNPDNKYTSYRWYRNDEEIPGAKKQFYNELGGLNGVYYAVVNDIDGNEIKTCPLEKVKHIDNTAPRVNVFPNPAVAGEQITLQLENMDVSQGITLMIFTSGGSFVQMIDNVQHSNYLTLPKGGYVGYALYCGEKITFKIVVEK